MHVLGHASIIVLALSDVEVLAGAFAWAKRIRSGSPRLEGLDWPEIAADTLAFYRSLRSGAS